MATPTFSYNKQLTLLLSQWENTVVYPYSGPSADTDRCIEGEKPGHVGHLLHAQIWGENTAEAARPCVDEKVPGKVTDRG